MIGFIDWTEKKLSLYIFEKREDGYSFIDTLSFSIEGELTGDSLIPFQQSNIEHTYLSVPVNLLSIRELDLPFSDADKIKDTVPFELEGILLGDIADYSIDQMITDSSGESSHVLAACIEKTTLSNIIDLFSSAGLDPVAVTSLDLRLAAKNPGALFENPVTDEQVRAETAGNELEAQTINLRQGELSYMGHIERMKLALRRTGVLVLALILILGVTVTIKSITLKKERDVLQKQAVEIYSKAFPKDTKVVDAARQFKGKFTSMKGKKNVLGGMPALDILLNIARLKDREITLNQLNADTDNIIIKGIAKSFENVDSFKNTLSSVFEDVRVTDSKASPDKKINFSITLKEKKL